LREAFMAAEAATQERAIAAVIEAFAPFKTDRGWAVTGVARLVTATKG